MKGFRKVLSYASEYSGKHRLSIILVFASVVIGIIPYVLVYNLITAFIQEQDISIGYAAVISTGVAFTMWLKYYLRAKGLIASHEVAFDTLMGMRIKFASKLIKSPMGQIQKKGIGEYKKNLIDDIDGMEIFLAHIIPEGLPYALSPIVVFIVLLIVDWRMALLSLTSIPFGLVAMAIMMKIGMGKMGAYFEAEKRMNKTIVEYINGMEVIKIFNRTTSSFGKYVKNVEEYRDFTLDWYRMSWTYMAIYTSVLPCTVLFMLPVGLHMYLNEDIALNTFIFCLMMAMSIGVPLVRLMAFMPAFPQLTYKIEELEKTFEGDEVRSGNIAARPTSHEVMYQNVTFAYEKKDVLKNVSFMAKENTVTAIVGESGSGKSTLARLLVKFWDTKEGKISIGGIDIDDMTKENLNNLVSYVAQDTFLFDIPLIENIRIGRVDATDEEVFEAAKAAQCHDFIMNLQNGYQTMPGDSGDKLSGGEKQRITIARAILKNTPIIVLDEATSATDAENEDLIQDALNRLIQGKTLIVIAHRLSTIVEADQIIVMENGSLSDIGTHEELLENSVKYKHLWDAHMCSTQWDIIVHERKEEKEYV